MKMFQRSGRNSVSVQAGGSIVANALGKGSTVVSGTGNRVVGAGAYANVMGDVTIAADDSSIAAGVLNIDGPIELPLRKPNKYKPNSRGHNQIQVGDLKIETSGNHIMLNGVEDDAIVTVNGKQVWPIEK